MFRINVREVDLSTQPALTTPAQTAIVGAFDLPIPSEIPVAASPQDFRNAGSLEMSLIANSLVENQEVTVIRPRGQTLSVRGGFAVVYAFTGSLSVDDPFYLMFIGYDPTKGYVDVSYLDINVDNSTLDVSLDYALDGSAVTNSFVFNLAAPSITLPSDIYPLFFAYKPYTGTVSLSADSENTSLTFNVTVSRARTPWVWFSEFGNTTSIHQGFYLEGIDLVDFNQRYVVVVENIRVNRENGVVSYPSFDVVLHRRDDRGVSANTEVTRFRQVNLNPESPAYIERVIGNSLYLFDEQEGRVEVTGEYRNRLPFLRVVVNSDIRNRVAGTERWVPVGFEGIYSVGDYTVINANLPPNPNFTLSIYPPIRRTRIEQVTLSSGASFSVISNQPYGLNLQNSLHRYYLSQFRDDEVFPNTEVVIYDLNVSQEFNVTDWTEALPQFRFLIPFQGGDDGYIRVDENEDDTIGRIKLTPALLDNYTRIIPLLSGGDYDILLTPYIVFSKHPSTVTAFINAAENNMLYVFDIGTEDDTENVVINLAGFINSSFAATFYPWVRVLTDRGARAVPPSLAAYRSIRLTDPETGLAPVGARRGVVFGEPVRTVNWERLYDNKINPIVRVGNDVLLFGQKTMLSVNSALNRINVRRLLIAMRREIGNILSAYLFENNTSENRLRAEALVRQYLESLRLAGALTNYNVEIDAVTTPSDIDNNILRVQVTVQPARSIEYIDITFVITPTGVNIE